MKHLAVGWLFSLLVCSSLLGQGTPVSGHTLVVIPFENVSPTPGLEWLGEGFSEMLRSQLDSPILYVVAREERLRAYDRQGIPAGVSPSRATLYRLTEQMDVDYAALGSYSYDGVTLKVTLYMLDMRRQSLSQPITESAPLANLGMLERNLGWDVLHSVYNEFSTPKERYVAAGHAPPLEAQENYIQGLLTAAMEGRISHLREAARIEPTFSEAWLELGKSYFQQRQYPAAAAAFEKVPPEAAGAREAHFYLGLSAYEQGDYEKSEQAFQFVTARLPLAEVYNNLGVVVSHRDRRVAIEDFTRAVADDPSNPDYHFNLGLTLTANGDKAKAAHEFRIALGQHPSDGDAKLMLDSAGTQPGTVVNSAASVKVPAARLNREYQEAAFRQMTIQLQGWAEQQFSRSDPRAHARYHLELGKELLAHGFTAEAEEEFRHAAAIDASNPAPITALADVFDARGDVREARAQAETSLRLRESAEAYLVLSRLDLREERMDSAAQNVNRALQLEPNNPTARDLERTIAAKLAEKAQPLPQP